MVSVRSDGESLKPLGWRWRFYFGWMKYCRILFFTFVDMETRSIFVVYGVGGLAVRCWDRVKRARRGRVDLYRSIVETTNEAQVSDPSCWAHELENQMTWGLAVGFLSMKIITFVTGSCVTVCVSIALGVHRLQVEELRTINSSCHHAVGWLRWPTSRQVAEKLPWLVLRIMRRLIFQRIMCFLSFVEIRGDPGTMIGAVIEIETVIMIGHLLGDLVVTMTAENSQILWMSTRMVIGTSKRAMLNIFCHSL